MDYDTAKKAFKYNPETGDIFWRVATGAAKVGKKIGAINDCGYLRVQFNGELVAAHRVAWLITHKRMPRGEIDHINGVRHDNRISNLREVNTQGNRRNARTNRRNKSGVMGVYWSVKMNKWCAQIGINKWCYHLGSYGNWFDAVCARKAAEHKYGFHPNHGRTA